MFLPRIEYLQSNFCCIRISEFQTIWFSYQTMVAFSLGDRVVVRQNEWGSTTAKHLNWIDGNSPETRVRSEVFTELWASRDKPPEYAIILGELDLP